MVEKRKTENVDSGEKRRSSRNLDKAPPATSPVESAPPESKKQKTKEQGESEKKSAKGKKISVGDMLPDLSLLDQSSTSITLSEEAKSHGIVLFSYPAASTPGCTSQGCSYRDHYSEITDRGYKVYGISTDTVNAQEKFKTKQGFQCKHTMTFETWLIDRSTTL